MTTHPMTNESYIDPFDCTKIYHSRRHYDLAVAIEKGALPPLASMNWQQRAAVDAFLDGSMEPHSFWTVKVAHLGHGHTEALACKVHVDPWKTAWRRLFDARTVRGQGDREKNAQDAAKRAKTKVRRLCKQIGVDSLGTLTYAENMQDRDRCIKHWKEFIRRVKAVLGEFPYVATIEVQKRGALHIHLGMRRLPARVKYKGCKMGSWDFMRAVWRRVIGGGGNFDEQKKLGRGNHARVMKIASYVGKYVAKEFADGELNRKRYFASDVPERNVEVVRFPDSEAFSDLIGALYSNLSGDLLDFQTYLQPNRQFFWFSAHSEVLPP